MTAAQPEAIPQATGAAQVGIAAQDLAAASEQVAPQRLPQPQLVVAWLRIGAAQVGVATQPHPAFAVVQPDVRQSPVFFRHPHPQPVAMGAAQVGCRHAQASLAEQPLAAAAQESLAGAAQLGFDKQL